MKLDDKKKQLMLLYSMFSDNESFHHVFEMKAKEFIDKIIKYE